MAHLPLTLLHRQKYIQDQLNESADTKKKMFDACAGDILKAVDAIMRTYNSKGKVFLCGNGGSAADSQHMATELVIRMSKPNRPALAAIALTTDSSMLTAGGNDLGFENIFARQIEGLGNAGDTLIAISTSGKSENVNRAIIEAKKRGMTVVGFLGREGGTAKALVDISIIIPSDDTQRIQEGHITVAHIICGIIENEMFG
ncbi:MAG: D-sedoheptulose 7-phosphate isomerase [Ignavibacteriae bacterium]|nr:D-sedoheptulose 7-phosphate isomerase [Ignavibacteria bacterium]MBI3365557.1 D-sedoheptulose 7-phosphate isomerase [Ignavibacteriota bacterium]